MLTFYRRKGDLVDYKVYKEAFCQATTETKHSRRNCDQTLPCNIKHDSKSWFEYVRSKQKVQDKLQ